jgi:hypothetical protein
MLGLAFRILNLEEGARQAKPHEAFAKVHFFCIKTSFL